VVPVYLEQASRPLVDIRTLRGSVLFEPGALAARGSSLLGKGQGHLMPTVAAIVTCRGRAFSGAASARVVGGVAGGRDRLPRPSSYRVVMMARVRLCGCRGRGGPRSSVREYFTCS
jgi:hypothetical protein